MGQHCCCAEGASRRIAVVGTPQSGSTTVCRQLVKDEDHPLPQIHGTCAIANPLPTIASLTPSEWTIHTQNAANSVTIIDIGPSWLAPPSSPVYLAACKQLQICDGSVCVLDSTRTFANQRGPELSEFLRQNLNQQKPIFLLLNKLDMARIVPAPSVDEREMTVPKAITEKMSLRHHPVCCQVGVANHFLFDTMSILNFLRPTKHTKFRPQCLLKAASPPNFHHAAEVGPFSKNEAGANAKETSSETDKPVDYVASESMVVLRALHRSANLHDTFQEDGSAVAATEMEPLHPAGTGNRNPPDLGSLPVNAKVKGIDKYLNLLPA